MHAVNMWQMHALETSDSIQYFEDGERGGGAGKQNTWGPDGLGGAKISVKRQVMGATVKEAARESVMHNRLLVLGPNPGSCQPCNIPPSWQMSCNIGS